MSRRFTPRITGALGSFNDTERTLQPIGSPTAPVLAGISPSQAPIGTTLALIGSGFLSGMTVQFTGPLVSATATNITANGASVVVPNGTVTGNVTVTTSNGVSNAQTFTVGTLQTYGHLAPPVSYVAPIDVNTGAPMVYNGTTGVHNGTTVDTREPTWAFTVTLTDTGNKVTNLANLQAAVDTAASGMTGNTVIRYPAGFATKGSFFLRSNATGFWVGIAPVPAVEATFPPLANGLFYGTKTNRMTPALYASQLSMEPSAGAGVTDSCILPSGFNIQRYWMRGIRLMKPVGNNAAYLAILAGNFYGGGAPYTISAIPTSTTIRVDHGFTYTMGNMGNRVIVVARPADNVQSIHRVTNVTTVSGTLCELTVTPALPGTVSVVNSAIRLYLFDPHGTTSIVPTPEQLLPRDITLVQYSVDGGGIRNPGVASAIVLGGRRIAVCDGIARNTGRSTQDSQEISIFHGEGPYKTTNNDSKVGGSGKYNWLIGGVSLLGINDEYLPRNIECRGWLFGGYPTDADGFERTAKCVWELKYGRNVLCEGNDVLNEMLMQFRGVFVVKLTDQVGPNSGTDTAHVCIRANRSLNVSAGLSQISGAENYAGSNVTRNVSTVGNLGVTTQNLGVMVYGSTIDHSVAYNTLVGDASTINFISATEGGYVPSQSVTVAYNVIAGAGSISTYEGLSTVQALYPEPPNIIVGNVVARVNTNGFRADDVIPSGGTTQASIGFADLANGNYRLANGSAGKNAAPNSKDCGASIDLIDALMAQVS